MNTLQIIFTVLSVVSFAAMSAWLVMLLRVASSVRASISMRRGARPEPEGGWPPVAVVVPPTTRRTSSAAPGASCRSTSGSRSLRPRSLHGSNLRAVIGDDSRFEIVVIEECPEDWAGKCNAAAAGARRATGDYLVFTDADTEFDPDLIRSSVAIALDREVDLLSILSTLSSKRDERIVQPVATMNLLRVILSIP